MDARRHLMNNYIVNSKSSISIPKRIVTRAAPVPTTRIHTREIVVDPSKLNLLEHKHDIMQNILSEKDKEIKQLREHIDNHSQSLDHLLGISSNTDTHVSNLSALIANLSDTIDGNKSYLESVVSSINDILSQRELEVKNLQSSLQHVTSRIGDNDIQLSDLLSIINNLTQAIADKQQQLDEMRKSIAELPTSLSEIHNLKIGDQTNLPVQPDPVRVNGVYKVADLALAVNGGVVLHDIGYSDSKNLLPLGWDPSTSRLVIKTGK